MYLLTDVDEDGMIYLMAQETHRIEIISNLEVVGYNHENADLDRPNGEVIDDVFYLVATNGHGDRRIHGGFKSYADAEAAIPDAPPVVLWSETQPEYGSPAWQEYGEDMELDAESRHADAEAFGLDTRFMIFS